MQPIVADSLDTGKRPEHSWSGQLRAAKQTCDIESGRRNDGLTDDIGQMSGTPLERMSLASPSYPRIL